MLQCGCKLYVSCSFCCSPCSQPVHLAIWKIHGKKRKAICALVLKVGIIKPLRFNGYSSWLTNNLLCLHYFVCVFPYEKQRIEKKDQRLQTQLCFESQNPSLPSKNQEGFCVRASDSHCALASARACHHFSPPPARRRQQHRCAWIPAPVCPWDRGPEAKASPHGSLLPLLPCRHGAHQSLGPSPPPARGHPPAHPQCPLHYRNSSGSRGSAQIMRNGYFLLSRIRQKFVM